MKKKACLVLAGVMAFGCMTGLLSACTGDPYAKEQLAPDEIRVNVSDGVGHVRWSKVEGAEGYRIYSSETRYGKYAPVTEETVTKCNYSLESDLFYYYKITALVDGKEQEIGDPVSAFSKNTLLVSPKDDMQAVQKHIDETHERLESGSRGQFSDERFAIMLLPGEYDLTIRVGYYTSAYGLGDIPTDVTVKELYVSTNVLSNNNSTCTFWRGAENFTVDAEHTQWAVSQATSLRRMNFTGDLALSHPSGWSSGGFLANSKVAGTVSPGTQQQWMSRNDAWGKWQNTNGSHNLVFSGCTGSIPADAWSDGKGRFTGLETTERIAEKPFPIYNGGDYSIFIPSFTKNTKGVTWEKGLDAEKGKLLSLEKDFYVASELTDDDVTLNKALADGKNILLTPGHYRLNHALKVNNSDTVILGLGYATLEITDENSDTAIRVAEADGVRLGDFLVDAGKYSKTMVTVGNEQSSVSHADNPIVLSNIFLRIGGAENVHTETDTAMEIHANDTIGDNFWIWRADHSRGTAWEDTENEDGSISYGNPVQTGLRVTADNVICYALMVEHTEGYQTLWEGENGCTVMYQCETPYRLPYIEEVVGGEIKWVADQSKWMDGDKNGYAAYKVADSVERHRAYGIGIYLVNFTGGTLDSAIEVPVKSGIEMYHLVTCSFSASEGARIQNVINDQGGWVGDGSFRRLVERYPV